MSNIIHFIVTNNDGIHARTAAMLFRIIQKYDVTADLKYNDSVVNISHIIDVIALSINKGSKVDIIINGGNTEECYEELVEIINKNLGEII